MVVVKDLSKRYREREAVQGLTFSVKAGEVVGFLGPNGAGKSTTMKMLTGFLPPSAGSARINGFDVFESPLDAKRAIGYLPETPPLYVEMTVAEYLRFVARIKGLSGAAIGAEVKRVTELTGLGPETKRLIGNLSKGFRQRVGLAQALLGSPPLLILDEPTEGLDPKQRGEVLTMLKGLGAQHTVILSTHILSEVRTICERVLIIHRGKLVADQAMASFGSDSTLEETFIRLTAD